MFLSITPHIQMQPKTQSASNVKQLHFTAFHKSGWYTIKGENKSMNTITQ